MESWRLNNPLKRLVVTNGCFDLLHVGHVSYLNKAKELGDVFIVGINGDESVRKLKGKNRPINNQNDRAYVLASLASVDFVIIFEEERAANFLRLTEPDIYVKAGDYTIESLYPTEKEILERNKIQIIFLPFVEGKSTTKILESLNYE